MDGSLTRELWIGRESYDDAAKAWLARSGHYLENPSPGCLFCVVTREAQRDLLGGSMGVGPILGMCLVGRPVAPGLPQDGSIGEITRFVLVDGLPKGTASRLLLVAAEYARARKMVALIAYHDRTRHTGCIYKKAGFKKDGVVRHTGIGWASRNRPKSGSLENTPKRRWRLAL